MKLITTQDAFDRMLPKWPQMLVTGQAVTVEQAKDIIFRTDTSLTSVWGLNGNDQRLKEKFAKASGYEKLVSQWPTNFDKFSEAEKQKVNAENRRRYEAELKLYEKAGFVRTEYVSNNWAACSFIYGPHGWCHPDGTIAFVDNVGKWPDVKDVFNDWVAIAQAWPFLDLFVTLMSAEQCEEEAKPVVTFQVKDGQVICYEGTVECHANQAHINRGEDVFVKRLQAGYSSEQGLPYDWLPEFVTKIRPLVDEVLGSVDAK